MFEIGDKVLAYPYSGRYDVNVIRARYRAHYLISPPSWRHGHVRHIKGSNLLALDSPLIPRFKEIDSKIGELDDEIFQLNKMKWDIRKGKI